MSESHDVVVVGLGGAFPVYIWEMKDGNQFYEFPAQPGVPGVKVAFFCEGPEVDPDDVNRVVSEADVTEMRAALAPRIPTLADLAIAGRTRHAISLFDPARFSKAAS